MLMMDSVPVTEQLSYSFFVDNDEKEDSVVNLIEDRAVRWLFDHPVFRNDFIREFFPRPDLVHSYFRQTEPFTQPKTLPGDIDLLLVHRDYPLRPIAFECKRVKIVSRDKDTPTINRLQELTKGIQQANGYRSLGFHQSYLFIILLDDGRAMRATNQMFRYAPAEPMMEVFNIPWHEDLHSDVGVIYVRINQMTGKSINHSHSIGYCIDKKAVPLEQTAEMTNKIRSLF